MASVLWNEILSEIHVTPILMVFQNALKPWWFFCVLSRTKTLLDELSDLECVVWMVDVFWNTLYKTFCILLFVLNCEPSESCSGI